MSIWSWQKGAVCTQGFLYIESKDSEWSTWVDPLGEIVQSLTRDHTPDYSHPATLGHATHQGIDIISEMIEGSDPEELRGYLYAALMDTAVYWEEDWEFTLWSMVTGKSQGSIDQESLSQMNHLSQKLGEWFIYDGEFTLVPIPLREWEVKFQAWLNAGNSV